MVKKLDPFAGASAATLELEDAAGEDDRIRRVRKPVWVEYPAGAIVLHRLAWLYSQPATTRPYCLLLYGHTNSGKTALVRKFARDRNAEATAGDDRAKKPVIYVQSPPYPDVGGLYDGILRSVGAPFRPTARPTAKWDQILRLLPQLGCRMVIVDEVNNMFGGRGEQRNLVLNSLKGLSNELEIPVVAIGAQETVRVFQTDQQVGNRFEPYGFPRWKVDEEYVLFVNRVVERMRLLKQEILTSKRMIEQIHQMAEGLTGETCKLLKAAGETAIHSGREAIDEETLAQVPWIRPSERRREER